MGPTNVALVKLFRADQALREAQSRLDAASKNVRVQDRKVAELAERVKLTHAKLREHQTRGSQFELDVKTREARIEKLRSQQQNAHNNKEYQAFLIEISTEKVDRGKAEDELIKVMELIEASQAELKDLSAHHDSELEKATEMKAQIGQTVATLQADVDALRPAREAAAEAVPARYRQIFERLAERYEGEALSALSKPDRRREEYLCSGCNMDLVADVYNRLHTRDELVYCTSCGRMLYIPEDLPPDVAINSRGKTQSPKEGSYGAAAPRSKRAKVVERLDPSERRAKGKLGQVLTAAQGESVKIALDAALKPIECDVVIDGKAQGTYKGKSGEHLQRIISMHLEEAGMKGDVAVAEKAQLAQEEADVPELAPLQAAMPESQPQPNAETEPISGEETMQRPAEQPASTGS